MERLRTNPAYRLHLFLKHFDKKLRGKRTEEALTLIFGKSDRPGMFRTFGKLLALVDQVDRCIDLISEDMREE